MNEILNGASMASEESLAGFRQSSAGNRFPQFTQRREFLNALLNNDERLPVMDWKHRIWQAMGTADFPQLTGAVLERRLLGMMALWPETIEKVCARVTRGSFNLNNVIRLDGVDGRLEKVAEGGDYTLAAMTESNRQYKVGKWGKKFALSWESLVNDDLNAFETLPARMMRGAMKTRQLFMTSLFWNASGALSTLFDATGGQTAVSQLPLNAANLATGLAAMRAYKFGGEPIVASPKYLVVCPALEQTAIELVDPQNLAALVTGLASTSSGTKERVSVSNRYVANFKLQVLVDPWIPLVATSGSIGSTAWMLTTDPMDIPAAEIGVLRGHEEPAVYTKAADAVRVGGGADGTGSFSTDSVEYKVRDVFGGVAGDPQARFVSNGQ